MSEAPEPPVTPAQDAARRPPPSRASSSPIVVIGGGPAGSTAASLLREHGHDVVLLEKARFPRFHIGESLLTYTQDYWDRLGLADALQECGYKVKKGGEARVGIHPDQTGFHQSIQHFWKVPKSVAPKRPWAYQVERAKFDDWLLRRAKERGVVVHEGAKVEGFTEAQGDDEAEVTWRDEGGELHTQKARFVIDASGRHAVLARKLGCFAKEDRYMTSSVFGQFEGVTWPDDEDENGRINVYFLQDGWIWFIPLGDKTSVGIVMNEHQSKSWPRDPQQIFEEVVGRFDYLRDRFGPDAKQLGPIRILRNLPYYSTQLVGEGWAQCGDAALFVDPIHSSGIHLAFYSATALADEVHAHLSGDEQALARYEKRVQAHHDNVRYNVSLYYRVVRYRSLMYWFVRGTGQLSNHWGGPVLRRVNAWSFGNYDKFLWAMRMFWGAAFVGLFVFGLWHKLTGRDPWGKHGFAAPKRPFSVPRVDVTPEHEGRAIALPTPDLEHDAAFHLEPGAVVPEPTVDTPEQASAA